MSVAAILLITTAIPDAELFAQANTAPNQPEEHHRRASRWDHATAERFFRKGAWREGVAYLGCALRLDPQNSAAARHFWSAVVHGEGDRHTVPELAVRLDAEISAAIFSGNGQRILVTLADEKLRCLDAATGVPAAEKPGDAELARARAEDAPEGGDKPAWLPADADAVSFSPDRKSLVVITDGKAQVWNAASRRRSFALSKKEVPAIDSAHFSPDGTRIVTVSTRTGQLWDAATGKPVGGLLQCRESDAEGGATAHFSPDGAFVLLEASEDSFVRAWDCETGAPHIFSRKEERSVLPHPEEVMRVAFTADGARIVTDCQDDTVRVWEDGALIAQFRHELPAGESLVDIALSADGTRVLTVAPDRTLRVFRLSPAQPLGELHPPAGRAAAAETRDIEIPGRQLALSPDDARLLTEVAPRTTRLWHAATREPAGEPIEHEGDVAVAAFSGDGHAFVVVCEGREHRQARVWETASGSPLSEPLRLAGHDRVEFSADGTRVVETGENHRREHEVPPPLVGAPPPPAFIEALCGCRFSEDGVLRRIPDTELAGLRAQLRNAEVIAAPWRTLIAWWLTPAHTQPIFPASKLTRRELADRELAAAGGYAGNAGLLDPTHPLVPIALAKFASEKRADFLRAYGLKRLPDDPAIRARAEKMISDQKSPP